MSDDCDDLFAAVRSRLHGIAYRMLGDVAEADDVVQETWLKWRRVEKSRIEDPVAYLVAMATRAAIDHLRRARARREDYVGPWLPEPLPPSHDHDPAADVERSESISLALLVVLETLSPLERAVFVLHEAFGYTYPEIATAVDRTEAAVRQLGHRARSHVRARRLRFQPDPAVHRAVSDRFVAAATSGELVELLELLAPDVELVVDGGGHVTAPPRPIRGAQRVARWLAGRASHMPQRTEVSTLAINGEPAALLADGDGPYALIGVDLAPDDDRIAAIRMLGNPDKLARALAFH